MDLDHLTPTVDKSQVPPLHQKRIVAFVNHFLISSCSFLNEFATHCESQFIALERKIQRLEASLTIIEAKLASIPADTYKTKILDNATPLKDDSGDKATQNEQEIEKSAQTPQPPPPPSDPPAKAPPVVRASEDVRYAKFFKMVRFGVDPNAVKQKMVAEGFDPSILDNPNLELPDGVKS